MARVSKKKATTKQRLFASFHNLLKGVETVTDGIAVIIESIKIFHTVIKEVKHETDRHDQRTGIR